MHYDIVIFSGFRNFFYISGIITQFLRMETSFKGNLNKLLDKLTS
jgi:hypothetical protein